MIALTAKRIASAMLLVVLATGAEADEAGDTLFRNGHYGRAIEWWRGAALGGDEHAAWRLGAVYLDGVVIERDLSRATQWLRVAAEAGQPAAQLDLATLYDRGAGVEQSHAEAARWYRAAAEAGEVASQFNLGSLYELGEGVGRDAGHAYTWYSLAAGQGFGPLAVRSRDRVGRQLGAPEIEAALRRARSLEAAYMKRGEVRPEP